MKGTPHVRLAVVITVGIVGLALTGCPGEAPIVPPPPVPEEYADKHMPEGWWADEKIAQEGKDIFEGRTNIDVNCASCHGKDGKPKKAGARDFRRTEQMKLYSDSVWFWRVMEGVPKTKMKPWKTKLKEEDIWKVIAHERTFGLKGMKWDVEKKQWVSLDGAAPSKTMNGEPEGEAKGK